MQRGLIKEPTPHGPRHSHASELIPVVGIEPVSKRIGHANVTVTSAVYSHLTPDADSRMAPVLRRGRRRHRAIARARAADSPGVVRRPSAAYALLAWEGDQLAGFASYSFLWPNAGLTMNLFVRELYVIEQWRRRGVGRALMNELFDITIKAECSRVEWTADGDNGAAYRFYERLGARVLGSKVFYRADGGCVALRLSR
ncbi:GNAT family N-acetyltransferase [Nonomuraea sp. NPDC049750]|uniref:GNAT family N-acetyltransferase n=1 Tax=Nonomuraea sp. NPDC049750 TaxID=3154738 RepID=UPI0033FB34FE